MIQEAVLLNRLVHPHIVRAYEANVIEDANAPIPYLTMEYIDGGTLEDRLQLRVRLDPGDAVEVANQIGSALATTHAMNPPLVHRDVKPQNILVLSDEPGHWNVKLGDFGLARHVDPTSLITRAAGTLHYLAPEAAFGVHSPASDVYALGVVLYRMLTGVFPFAISTSADTSTLAGAQEAVVASRKKVPLSPSRLRIGLDPAMDALILSVLDPLPQNRPADGTAFVDALHGLQAGGLRTTASAP